MTQAVLRCETREMSVPFWCGVMVSGFYWVIIDNLWYQRCNITHDMHKCFPF